MTASSQRTNQKKNTFAEAVSGAPKSIRRSLKRTAYHEAGHVVLSCVLDRRFKYVTIVPTKKSSGHLHYDDWLEGLDLDAFDRADLHDRDLLERVVMACFAGVVAETLASKRPRVKKRLLKAADGDLDDIDELFDVAGVSDRERQAYHLWLFARTVDLVHSAPNRRAVHAVAAALLRCGKLSYADAARIVADARCYEDQLEIERRAS